MALPFHFSTGLSEDGVKGVAYPSRLRWAQPPRREHKAPAASRQTLDTVPLLCTTLLDHFFDSPQWPRFAESAYDRYVPHMILASLIQA